MKWSRNAKGKERDVMEERGENEFVKRVQNGGRLNLCDCSRDVNEICVRTGAHTSNNSQLVGKRRKEKKREAEKLQARHI